MKQVRYSASLLLILAGVLHLLSFFMAPHDPAVLPMLAFAVVYLSTALLLFLNLKMALLSGIGFPLTGMVAGFFVIGPGHLDTLLVIMFAIDAAVVVCCSFLYFNGKKADSDRTG
jgi:hypothetical protein